MPHPLSLAFLTTFDVGPAEAVRIAGAAGYQMAGLRILPSAAHGEGPYPLLTDDAELARVLEALDATGVSVGDVEIIRLAETCDWDLFDRFCDRCAALSARHVLVAGDDTEQQRLIQSYARFCDMSATRGLTADLEFMPWTAVRDLATARAIIEAADRPNSGVLIDALHMDRSATPLDEVARLPRERINYVQLCDAPVPFDRSDTAMIRVARSARLYPGEGAIDLIGLVSAIPDGVTFSVEVPNHGLAANVDPLGRAEMGRAATMGLLRLAGRA